MKADIRIDVKEVEKWITESIEKLGLKVVSIHDRREYDELVGFSVQVEIPEMEIPF